MSTVPSIHPSIQPASDRVAPVNDDWLSAGLLGVSIEVQAQSVLFRQGDRIHTLCLVDSGVVALNLHRDGRDVLVALRSRGWLLGAVSALLDDTHETTAVALSAVRFRVLPIGRLRELVETDPVVNRRVIKMLAGDVREQLHRTAGSMALSTRPLLEDLLKDLFRLAGEPTKDGAVRLGFPMTVQQLADAVMATREQTNRILRQMMSEKLLRRDRRGWLVAAAASTLNPTNHLRSITTVPFPALMLTV